MCLYSLPKPRGWGVGWAAAFLVLVITGCAPTPTAPASPSPLATGMARVWFLRQADPPGGEAFAASPMISVDRAPLAELPQGAFFYHDFPSGRYRLSAQAFGTPAGQHDILHLDAGEETFVQVMAVANWELGSPVGGWSFAVLPMAPALAKQYLPTLSDLGHR